MCPWNQPPAVSWLAFQLVLGWLEPRLDRAFAETGPHLSSLLAACLLLPTL